MKKRYVSIVLILCLLISILVSCTKGGKIEVDSSQSGVTSETGQPTEVGDSGLNMSDISNMTAPGVLPIVAEPITMTLGLKQNGFVIDYDDNWLTKKVLEDTGISLKFVLFPTNTTEARQKLELMISSNQELPEIFHFPFSTASRHKYGKDGILLPLNDYFEKYAHFYNLTTLSEEEREDIRVRGTSPDGNIYTFTGYINNLADIPLCTWYINQAWLDKLGLEKPKTTDELYDVLKAFKEKDPNRNGKKDEIPLISSSGWNGNIYYLLINSFIYYEPSYPFTVEDDGTLSVTVIKDEYRDALRYMSKLCKEDLLSPLTFTLKNDGLKAMLSLPEEEDSYVGMFGGTPTTLFDAENEKPFEYDAQPQVKGPNGISWVPQRGATLQHYTAISKYCKNPEIAFRLFDYFTDPKMSLTNCNGVPGEHWLYRPDDPELFDKTFPYTGNILGYTPLFSQIPGVPNPWTNQNKTIWNVQFCSILPLNVYSALGGIEPIPTYYEEAKEKGFKPVTHRRYMIFTCCKEKVGRNPDKVVKTLIYTEEEQNAIADISASINGYIKEAIALFCTGAMDIEKDWDSYVHNLESIGLDEYLKTAQAAYDRMYK